MNNSGIVITSKYSLLGIGSANTIPNPNNIENPNI